MTEQEAYAMKLPEGKARALACQSGLNAWNTATMFSLIAYLRTNSTVGDILRLHGEIE